MFEQLTAARVCAFNGEENVFATKRNKKERNMRKEIRVAIDKKRNQVLRSGSKIIKCRYNEKKKYRKATQRRAKDFNILCGHRNLTEYTYRLIDHPSSRGGRSKAER